MDDQVASVPTSVPELIERWDSIAAFAKDVGCGYEAARKMRSRESIAPANWQAVIVAAEAKGVPGIDWAWLAQTKPQIRA